MLFDILGSSLGFTLGVPLVPYLNIPCYLPFIRHLKGGFILLTGEVNITIDDGPGYSESLRLHIDISLKGPINNIGIGAPNDHLGGSKGISIGHISIFVLSI